jgi:hypothetical protein
MHLRTRIALVRRGPGSLRERIARAMQNPAVDHVLALGRPLPSDGISEEEADRRLRRAIADRTPLFEAVPNDVLLDPVTGRASNIIQGPWGR